MRLMVADKGLSKKRAENRVKLLRNWLILVPVVVGLILVSIFIPARQVTIEGIGRLSFETTVTLSVGSEAAYASPATERQSPDVLLQQDNLSGAVTDIDEDPDSPDANWLTYSEKDDDTKCRVGFPTPTGNPTIGADLQEFKIWVRQQPDGGGADPTVSISLYENGALVAEIMADSNVTSPTGQLFSATWNANLLSNADGSEVECYIFGTAIKTGPPANRCTVEVGAVEWNVDYSIEPDISVDPTSKDFGLVAENSSYWSNGTTPPTFPLDDGECYFSVTNNSSGSVDISIRATNFSGGVGWTLAGSPGVNIVTLKAGKSGDNLESDMVTLTTLDQSFISGLGATLSKRWELKLETGTFTDSTQKTSTITLTATFT
jgi:hypothetical protein